MNRFDRRPPSSTAFDWTMAVLGLLMIGGIFLDGWAHSHGEVDQSFLTPWHALLYSGMALNGLVLAGAGILGLRRGFQFREALPTGYWTSALGVVLFLLGGGFDLWWHTVFGIETGITPLLSPSHLVLALGAAMVVTGPLRSIAAQYGPSSGGWRRVGPAVCSVLGLLALLGFFVDYAQPIEDGFFPVTLAPHGTPPVASLYSVTPSGALTRLPADGADLWGVQASPDGKHIVYRVNHGGGDLPPSVVVVANADGTHALAITHSGRHDTVPAWSPDGKWIAYISMPANTSGTFDLHVVRRDGSGDRTLVSGTTTLSSPAWSPDGTHIAYDSRDALTAEIAQVDVATGASTWLPFTAGGSTAAWSTGGFAWIDGNGNLQVTRDFGKTIATVVHGAAYPAWSPNGRALSYVANDGDNVQVFVVGANGAHPHDVSSLPGLDASRESWSPDGRIYFTASGTPSPARSDFGLELAEAASLLQAVMLTAAVLLLVRRWRAPPGAIVFLMTFFALAMAVQSDLYVAAIPAAIVGLAADVAIFICGDRVRGGRGLAALGFLLPATFTAGLIVAIGSRSGGYGWPADMLMGTPLLAGIAGLFVAFCFDLPLAQPGLAQYAPSTRESVASTDATAATSSASIPSASA